VTQVEQLQKLREPFPPSQIGKLPKGGIQLDFVGHGYITQRLLDVDPQWSWEPFALGPDGLPLLDEFGGLWIRLTVCGVTRIGYGDAGGRKGNNAVKEAIGDALRNAGMRFGWRWTCGARATRMPHRRPNRKPPLTAPATNCWRSSKRTSSTRKPSGNDSPTSTARTSTPPPLI